MSFQSPLNDENEIFEPDVEGSISHDDVKNKFTLYHSNMEKITAKYEEAKIVIDRLKEEINVSREVEKSQRIRISSLQSRLTASEEKGMKIYKLSEKQKNYAEQIRNMETSIIDISNVILEIKQKLQCLITSSIKDIEIIQENKDLRCLLKGKEAEFDALKAKLNTGKSENEQLVERYQKQNEELLKEIEVTKLLANEAKDHYDKVINTYKQQTVEYERIIEEMEEEKRSLLGDYAVINSPHHKSKSVPAENHHHNKSVTCIDGNVTCFNVERENGMQHFRDKDLAPIERNDNFQGESRNVASLKSKPSFPESHKTNSNNGMISQFSKFRFKHKPKLEFLDQSVIHSEPQTKKRLYTQNSPYCIN